MWKWQLCLRSAAEKVIRNLRRRNSFVAFNFRKSETNTGKKGHWWAMGWWKEIVAPDASSNDSSSHNTGNHSASVWVLRGRKLQGSLSSAKSLTFHQHRNDRSSWEPWSPPLSIVSSWSKDREVFILPDWSSINSVVGWVEAKGQTSIKKIFFLIPLYPNQDSTINDLFWFLSCSTQRSLF